MVKIINEGKWKTPWKTSFVCKNEGCEATLEIEEDDLTARGDPTSHTFYITCPVCKRDCIVAKDLIAPRIKVEKTGKLKYSSNGNPWD